MWRQLFVDRSRWIGYLFIIAGLHLIGIIGWLSTVKQSPLFIATGLLAYTLGLRHAFDADHIAAIDNTVRKLIHDQRNSYGAGFYFSLGHSSVVFIMVLITVFSMQWVVRELPQLTQIGSMIGATVAGSFLLVIGVFNLVVFWKLYAVWNSYRNGLLQKLEFEHWLQHRSVLAKLVKPLFSFVSKSWHTYPLGFLFGLGFDTATEITLLVVSVEATQQAVSIWGILSLPLLFAAGMSLMDTLDGIFMTKTYHWALSEPVHKLTYNLWVTGVTVVAAWLIGGITISHLFIEYLGLSPSEAKWISQFDMNQIGVGIVVLFVISWIVFYWIWRHRKTEQMTRF